MSSLANAVLEPRPQRELLDETRLSSASVEAPIVPLLGSRSLRGDNFVQTTGAADLHFRSVSIAGGSELQASANYGGLVGPTMNMGVVTREGGTVQSLVDG